MERKTSVLPITYDAVTCLLYSGRSVEHRRHTNEQKGKGHALGECARLWDVHVEGTGGRHRATLGTSTWLNVRGSLATRLRVGRGQATVFIPQGAR